MQRPKMFLIKTLAVWCSFNGVLYTCTYKGYSSISSIHWQSYSMLGRK